MDSSARARVTLSLGELEGVYQDGLYCFKGVPFAAPPVGDLRWLPPQPPAPWDGVRKADRFGATAPQNPMPGGPSATEEPEPQSEDCLFLNIWTNGLGDKRRPVMVWIHGGAFTIGSGSIPVHDGGALARRQDVVVITLNYRLNLLGFLNLDEATGGKIPSTGNEGLLDQAAALRWVKEHIGAFGGDPDNVTVMGESAGSMSVACLLAMPSAEGLFDKAILESGVGTVTVPLADAAAVGRLFLEVAGVGPDAAAGAGAAVDAAGVGSDDVDVVRSLTPGRLLEIEMEMRRRLAEPWEELRITATTPVLDGRVIARMPTQAVAEGASRDVPILIGSNLEEWKFFTMMDHDRASISRAQVIERLGHFIPSEHAERIYDRYADARTQRGEDTSPFEILVALNSDLMFRIPSLQLAEAKAKHNPAVFDYLFTYKSPVFGGALGACHALEMGFVFATHDDTFCGTGPEADKMAAIMQDAWASFARTGDPSCASLGEWPPYGERRTTMILDIDSRLEDAPYEPERQAWDVLGVLSNILM